MTDPNPIVECIGPNGEKLYRRKRAALAWGFKITDRPATDGHGRPLPDKPKRHIPKATPKADTNPEKEHQS